MGQRVYVRRVDCHHRVEQEGQVDPLRLTGELEGVGIAVESPGPLGYGRGDAGRVGRREEPNLGGAVWERVDDLYGVVGDRGDRHDLANELCLQARQGGSSDDFGQSHGERPKRTRLPLRDAPVVGATVAL